MTAEEIAINNFMNIESGYSYEHSLDKIQKILLKKAMIEFAKYHVEQALKEADSALESELPEGIWDYLEEKNFILNAYSLENIK